MWRRGGRAGGGCRRGLLFFGEYMVIEAKNMDVALLREGLRRVEGIEAMYERLVRLLEPAELEENPLPAAKGCMAALRGLERCVELRLRLAREAERASCGEAEEAERARVDWSRLSDGALREVEAALVPCGEETPAGEVAEEVVEDGGAPGGEGEKENKSVGITEKRIKIPDGVSVSRRERERGRPGEGSEEGPGESRTRMRVRARRGGCSPDDS